MRITIGGVLFVVGAGAIAAVAFLPSGTAPAGVEEYITTIREKVNTSLGLFRSASGDSSSALPLMSTTTTAVETTAPVTAIPVAEIPIAAETPSAVPVVAELDTKPVVKKKSRTRRRSKKAPVAKAVKAPVKKTAVASKPAAAPAAAAAAKPSGSLVGKDVVLTLTTGRDVRGVLQEQDAIAYKVELPGLGTFTYPLQNVKTIRAE